MKVSNRIISMLLALMMVLSLLPAVAPTVAEAAVTDTPAGVRNHLPSTAKDVVYLSDMNWEYSINYQDKVAIKNGAWSSGGKIVMGLAEHNGGTVFEKGLGVMPKGTSATDASHTIFDLADNNYKQNYFYAAAGITNGTAQGGGTTNGLVFEVWGSYDKTVEDYTQAEYTLLERSGDPEKGTHVKGSYVYQFHLDVTGVRYLKLVVYAVGSVSYMNCNWAGVCVYNNPGYYPKSDLMGLNNGQDNTTYVPSGTDRFNAYHFENLPSDAVLLTSATYKDPSTYKGTSKVVDFKSASGNLGSGGHWLGGIADRLDTAVTPNLKEGIVLKDATKYLRFNARQPASSGNQTDGWVTFDISDLDVNRFYTVIGSGNNTAKHTAYNPSNGTYGGIKCQVWGAETVDGTYTLLSESEPILLSNAGEFLVDITGVNYLKLRIQAKDTRNISGLDILFYMPCVFNEWDIAASGAAAVMQGTQAEYTTAIRHDFTANYPYSGTVTWTVSGGAMAGTKIVNGKLSVDPAETATSLQVTASITEGGKTYTSAPVAVEVTKAPVYTLEIQGPEEAGKNTEQTVSAAVTKDGTPTSYDDITWTVTGNTDPATKVENGKLLVGNEPVGTTLTIKASFTEYGTTYEDTITVTIAAYGISIKGSTDMFPGTQITLDSVITNDGQPVDGTVTWSVEGNGTITPNGKQVVVTAGAIGTIKVTASWTTPANNPCTATHEIAVNAYTIDVSSPATAVSKGGTLPLTATVKKNGVAVADPSVSWTVVNLTNGDVTNKTGATLEWAANEAVDTILVFTASAQFGSQTISDTFVVKVTDYKLAIDQTDVQVEQGETTVLKATLTKGDAPAAAPMLNWSVSKVGGSTLNTSGDQLQLTANDPVNTELTVIVSCVVDGETLISAPAKVTVIPTVVYTVSLDKTSASIKPGESVDFTVAVTKDGTPVTDPALTWTVTGATTAETVIDANGKLTIGTLEPTGTVLNVTATYDAGGKLITSAAAVVTVASAAAQSSFTAVTGEYATLPSNSIYLADEGVVWIESVNNGNAASIRNGAWSNGAAIWIGGGSATGGTKFDKGIGMQPQAPTATNDRGASWTTIDISTYDCDTFYAAVGSTNASNQQNGHNSFIYQVYGATAQDGPFTLLAESTPLTKTSTGEFKVDITGMKYLKLVVKCTETGNHGYGNSVWANACVYDSTADLYKITVTEPIETIQQGKEVTFTAQVTKEDQPVTDQTITWTVTGGTKPGTAISAEGKLTVDKDEPVSTKLTVTASITVGEDDVYTSEAMVITVTEVISEHFQEDAYKANTSGKYAQLFDNVIYLSDVDWVESVNNEGKPAIKNGAWANGAAIWIGGGANTGGTQFKKGIGVQPQVPNSENNRGASWTTIDVSKMNCDTFYAAIGGTNASNQQNGHNSFIYQVYGTYGDSSEFVLLAQSEPITKTQTGELTVNIKGVKLLKLVIKCTDTGGHGYGNSVWANACVYNKNGTPGNHPNPQTKPVTETPKQTDAFSKIEDGIYLTPTGKVTFLSDIDWVESVNLGGVEAIRNGVWTNGAAIWIGGTNAENGGKKFVKGIGVQAQAPTADNNRGASWTLIDVSELGCNTFFAVVGGTNASNQQNGHNSFIYQVYGGDSKDGEFTLLAQSEPITKTMTGEFQVDITGVKFLKLVIKCGETGNHGYGNSVWANACVFNSEEAQLVEDNGEVETGPTAPTTTKPKPSAPAKTDDDKDDGKTGLSSDTILYIAIGSIAALLLIVIVVVVIVVIKKKKVK